MSEIWWWKEPVGWECRRGHQWRSKPITAVDYCAWCPRCKWRAQEQCRITLEEWFGEPFPTVRPDFLRCAEHPRGLELDGYCEALGLAFEYQGEQHYRVTDAAFLPDDTEEALTRRKSMDEKKRKLCARAGVDLLVVPYWKASKMFEYMRDILMEWGYP